MPSRVRQACEDCYDAHKGDCSAFARAVAGELGVRLVGLADDIVQTLRTEPKWTVLADGVAAQQNAAAGQLVLAGLKGSEQTQPVAHGHVVVVIDGPLARGAYPTAYWGSLGGVPGQAKTLNWAWTEADRDHITYAATDLPDLVAAMAASDRMLGVDSLVPSASNLLSNARSAAYLGQMPALWGRYFYAPGQINSSGHKDTHYAAAENGFLRANGIRLLPVARQTGNVGGNGAIAVKDATNNVAAIFAELPPAYLSGADPDLLVFLDVEQDSPMTAEYFANWSATLIAEGAKQSGQRVRLHPAIYSSQSAAATWDALRAAIAGGAVCDGAWIARYYYPSPIPHAWSDALTTPANGLPCPILAWQYWESPDHAPAALNFDTTIVNPAHADILIGRLALPPG
jgi:hypothetical protein